MSDTCSKRTFSITAFSGLLLYASFFPLNWGFLAWFALVPWLHLVHLNPKPKRLYFHTWLGALIFTLPAMQWMRVAHPMMYFTWIALALYTSAYFVLALALIRKLDRNQIPLWLSAPIVWVGLEYCRAHFPTGFSWLESSGHQHLIGFGWYFLGYSQHDYLSLIQISDITGVYGLSFVIVLVNVAIYEWIRTLSQTETKPIVGGILAVVSLTGILVYGASQLHHDEFEKGPRIAALQANIPQDLKMKKGDELLQPYMNQWAKAMLPSDPRLRPDLAIWPETSCPDDWITQQIPDENRSDGRLVSFTGGSDVARALLGRYRACQLVYSGMCGEAGILKEFHEAFEGQVLFGLNTIETDPVDERWKYNSAVYFRDGEFFDRYDKIHLVPFGEYVPLRNWFPWLQNFTPYQGDYSCRPGERWTHFPVTAKGKQFSFGVIICYEDTDPFLARQYVAPAKHEKIPKVDFLVNISNDGWFRGSEEHEQHLAICRFRAVETRRSVVRAVNMGISAIVDPDGRVIALPGESWSSSKQMEGHIVGEVPIDHRSTIYSEFGDWLPITCWGAMLSGFLFPIFYRSRSSP
jgi:apolipoprotein N-acyltransferase